MKVGDKVRICLNDSRWQDATFIRRERNHIIVTHNTNEIALKETSVWRCKRGGRRLTYRNRHEIQPMTKSKVGRTKPMRVIPVVFNPLDPSQIVGNYRHMKELPFYKTDGIFTFNENSEQYLSNDTAPGGGNACVRPERQHNNAIGIVTGALGRGGFSSLEEKITTSDGTILTARELIDMGLDDLASLCRARTEKDKIYYCADSNGLLGCGIFNVSTDVRLHITKAIKTINYRMMRPTL